MKSLFTPEGKTFLVHVIAGSGKRIDGMYVEYGISAPASAAGRNRAYFNSLDGSPSAGYVRVPVQRTEVPYGATDKITYCGLIPPGAFPAGKVTEATLLTAVTLVNLGATETDDTLVVSILLTPFGKLVSGMTVSVTAALDLSL